MYIYTAGSISGKTPQEVEKYFTTLKVLFESFGYTVLNPMTAKGHLITEMAYRAADYRHPISTNRAILSRDRWMVQQADIIYADLTNATHASIGTMFELAWAYDHHKHTIIVMDETNIHHHAFVLESVSIVFPQAKEAIDYLKALAQSVNPNWSQS